MAEKKSGGFAKSFFGGFLGAVLALAVGVGAVTVANGGLSGLSSLVKSGQWESVEETQTGAGDSYRPGGGGIGRTDDSDGTATTPSATEDENNANASGSTVMTVLVSDESVSLAEAVAEKCLPSVVAIDIYTYGSSSSYYGYGYGYGYGYSPNGSSSRELELYSLGSGVVLTADGYVLTNYHVIEGYDAIRVTAEGEEYEADLVGSDQSSDLAVIKLKLPEGTTLTPMAIGDSDSLKAGQWVMTIGSPFGYEQSVATGIVSAMGRSTVMTDTDYSGRTTSTQLYVNLIQTDAAINPGNSGGAMVNAAGELVGINTLITSYSGNYSGVGFAIPVNYAYAIAQQIIAGQTPTHASLGVSLVTLSSSNASRYHTTVSKGVYLTRVYAGTGAEAAGLQEGDVVTAFEGKTIESASDLMLAVRSHNPGDTVSITINRDGTEMVVKATLGTDAD